ncbi:PREDICTED: uncharacterized protein LOC109463498 [Branchiostoma belcheri]|uniref:Uncharacterized protein LOC109463498 n=1 Tax=Branchiostoma belcheri TaxID=7741 RepID=A0A6P4YAQ9_BRABE|nr:PREDICTED: uncharacterized protein LOC109463498 [Branchiostoma belcheri]
MCPVLRVVFCTILVLLVTNGFVTGTLSSPVGCVGCERAATSSGPVAAAWRAQDYPSPLMEWQRCGRNRSSYLCDPDGILPQEDAAILDSLLFNLTVQTGCPCGNRTHCSRWSADHVTFANGTDNSCTANATTTSCDSCRVCSDDGGTVLNCSSCVCSGSCNAVTSRCHNNSKVCREVADRGAGYVMTVVLMRRMTLITSSYSETVDLAANRYADHFRDRWRLGRCGEAVVVVISMEERQIYTSTEKTAARRLSDLDLVYLYRDYVTEDFWTGNITRRLPVLIQQFMVKINTPEPPRRLFEVWLESWGNWFLFAMVCLSIASCILYKHRLKLYKNFPACCQKRWLKVKNKGRKKNPVTERFEEEVLTYEDTISGMRLEELQIRKNRRGFDW